MASSALIDFSKNLHSRKDSAHDFTHIQRMMFLCRKIAPQKADIDLITRAAYFHGLLREEKSIRSFLGSQGYEDAYIHELIKTVRNARSTAKPQTIEEKVLHDANILDSLGAVGIARAFTKGGYENQTLRETTEIMKKNMDRQLYTQKGKEISEGRKRFMKQFLKRTRAHIKIKPRY